MSTLAEIEAAADALPPEQKQELLLFLLTRLRAHPDARSPEPRTFSPEQLEAWIREDEADMKHLGGDIWARAWKAPSEPRP